jgi:ferric-dicitrate binding protein FerR (iron transport regulator)
MLATKSSHAAGAPFRHPRRCDHAKAQALLILAMMIVCRSSSASAQSTAGTITEVIGSATIRRGTQDLGVAAAMPVLVTDAIETRMHSRVTITLADGSQLRMSESTRIAIDAYIVSGTAPLRGSINLLIGRLRAVVNFAAGGPLPDFEVHTPNAIAGVRGTEFETAFIEGKPCPGFPACFRYTEVGVYKGVVEVSNPTNPSAPHVSIAPGYETNVPCELAPTSPGPLGMSELSAPGYR